jgi:hypothetical protein
MLNENKVLFNQCDTRTLPAGTAIALLLLQAVSAAGV